MSYLINNQQKLNDIIFANRNREYGAYVIRSSYGNTVFKSLSFMLTGVVTVMSLAYFLTHKNNNDPGQNGVLVVHDSIYVIPVIFPEKKVEPSTATEKNNPPPPAVENTDPAASTSTVIDEAAVESTVTTTTEPPVESTTATVVGNGTTSVISSSLTNGGGGGDTDSSLVVDDWKVDSPPVFEGGPAALRKFVAEHLKYPTWASSEGQEGTVYVKFVVDEHCKVGNLSLLNSIGYGMDDEAIRVVSLIPKFKSPAMVKGIPVKAYYQIPIRFRFK